MKKMPAVFYVFAALAVVFLFAGCEKNNSTRRYTMMIPVYEDKATVLANISSGAPRTLESPGKIFVRGRYLFINEINKGLHIIDNSNPSTPKPVSFISIPGNIDIAVEGQFLYADLFTDMLTIDISDPLHVDLVSVTPNVFPERAYTGWYWQVDSTKIVVDWIEKDTVVNMVDIQMGDCANCAFANSGSGEAKANSGAPGIAGSMTRFVIVDHFLYAVNNQALGVFDISEPSTPGRVNDVSVGWGIETIYPFRDKLFIGSTTGMFIYNIDDASQPVYEGSFTHANSCDPVISDGKYAYVTLRSGNNCQGFTNQLDIVDVSNVHQPELVKTYSLSNPHGLSKDGDMLFICDGEDGLKIYDAGNVKSLKMVKHFKNINAFDAIAWSDNLIISGEDGIYQFDYSNAKNIRMRSSMKVSHK